MNYIRVFYDYCDVALSNLAFFTRTTTGSSLTSLVETTGKCVVNSVLKVSDYFQEKPAKCENFMSFVLTNFSKLFFPVYFF